MKREHLKFPAETTVTLSEGSSGMLTQVPGGVTSVSAVASASGGIGAGNLIERGI